MNKKCIYTFLLLVLSIIHCKANVADGLEYIQDDELTNLIQTEKYVVVLFSRSYCDECDNFEKEIVGVREELVETTNSWVVKVVNSQLTRLYSPSEEPVLVFFRHGIPLLYNGPQNGDLILHTFVNNQEPAVKELNDGNFEHLTQAATGATTGDWLIMFYTPDCIDCQRFQARWEAVGAQLKARMNVARINKATVGAATARRFQVFHVPAVILLRQGKLYRYTLQKYDINAFVSFAQDWYKNLKPERVPLPKTPFDDFITLVTDYLIQNPWLWQIALITMGMGLVASLILKFVKRPSKSKSEKSSSKPETTKKHKEKTEKSKDK